MTEAKSDALVKSVESLLTEKQAVAVKEKELVDSLNRVLTKMGYEVVLRRAVPANGRRRRRRRGPGRPPGRPPKATAGRPRRRGRAAKAGNGRQGRRRRGRPRKTE